VALGLAALPRAARLSAFQPKRVGPTVPLGWDTNIWTPDGADAEDYANAQAASDAGAASVIRRHNNIDAFPPLGVKAYSGLQRVRNALALAGKRMRTWCCYVRKPQSGVLAISLYEKKIGFTISLL
jgi:hypothetical protein